MLTPDKNSSCKGNFRHTCNAEMSGTYKVRSVKLRMCEIGNV